MHIQNPRLPIDKLSEASDGHGIKFFDLGQLIFLCLGKFGVWVWEISQNFQIFQLFSIQAKKILSGWIKKYPGQRQVSPFFTVVQKYARVRSGLL